MAAGPSGQINIGDFGGTSDGGGGGGGISAGDVNVGDINIQEPDNVQTDDDGDTGGTGPTEGPQEGPTPSPEEADTTTDVDTSDGGGTDTPTEGPQPGPTPSPEEGDTTPEEPESDTVDTGGDAAAPPGTELDPSDLSPGARERLQQREQEFARRRAQRLSRQVPGEVVPSNVRTTIRRTSQGLLFTGELTGTARSDIQSRIARLNRQARAGFRSESANQRVAQAVEAGTQAREKSRQQARQDLAERVREQLDEPGFEEGDEFTIERSGDTLEAELTPQGREFATKDKIVEQGGEIEGLKFDEEGRIREPTRQERLADANVFERRLQIVLGPKGRREKALRRGLARDFERVAGPPGSFEQDVRAAIPSEVKTAGSVASAAFDETVEDIETLEGTQAVIGPPGERERQVLEASGEAAEFLGTGVDVLGEAAVVGERAVGAASPTTYLLEDTTPGEELEEVRTAAEDIGQEEDVAEPDISESVAQQGVEGAAGLAPFLARSPQFVQGVGEKSFEAGATALDQNPAESAVAAGAFTEETARQVATQVVRNPVETGGLLVATGGVFAAARAVGPRTSLLTRGALQPGEELIGRGGAATFRGTASAAERAGLSRTASALETTGRVGFPRGEPLFASEEAAIMVGSRAAGLGRGGAGRLRSRVGGVSSRIRQAELPTVEGLRAEFEGGEPLNLEARFNRLFEGEPPGTQTAQEFRRQLEEEPPGAATARGLRQAFEGGEPLDLEGRFNRLFEGEAPGTQTARGLQQEFEGTTIGGGLTGYDLEARFNRLFEGDAPGTQTARGLRQEFEGTTIGGGVTGYDLGARFNRLFEGDAPGTQTAREFRRQLEEEPPGAATARRLREEFEGGEPLDLEGRFNRLFEGEPPGTQTAREFRRQLEEEPPGAATTRALRQEFEGTTIGGGLTGYDLRARFNRLFGDNPGQRLTTAEAGEPAPIRSPRQNPLDVEADTETEPSDDFTGGEPTEIGEGEGGGEAFVPGETGVGRQRVVGRSEVETETETERELQPELEAEAERRFRTQLVVGESQSAGTDLSELPGSEFDRPRPGEFDLERDLNLENELEPELESEGEQELELETEAEQEAEAEVELELERELEQEFEAEVEREIEAETELAQQESDSRYRRVEEDEDEFLKRFETGVATPSELLSGGL